MTRLFTLTTYVQYHIRSLTNAIKYEREKKMHKDYKERKLSLLADDMILCIENSKDSTKSC